MPQNRLRLNVRAALPALIASAYPVIGYSAPAAQVDFAVGNVTAVGANGQTRALGKGAQVEQGDTINTNGGRAQLRFTDGAYVSLQPESQFRIDQYRYEGKSDGNEKGFFSLLKGGLRTITGLVGRSNKRNYQVSTSVATIGIRGTEYTIQYGKSVTGTVGEGEINVCNGAGCLSVVNGESYYVQNQELKPTLTNKRTDLPPPAPTTPPTHFAESENVNANGEPCVLVPCATEPPPPPPPLLTGTFPASIAVAHTEFTGNGSHIGATVYSGSATFDNGKLVSMTDNGGAGTVSRGTTSMVDAGGDQFIAWGRLTNGTLGGIPINTGDHAGGLFSNNESFHFVVGLPTVTLPTIGSVTYTLLGATAPTFSSGSGLVSLGSLESLTLLANLSGTRTTGGSFTMSLKDPALNLISFNGSFSGGAVFSGSSTTGTGAGCSGSCGVSLNGFFAGANAERAGVSYQVQTPGCSTGCTGVGVAALKR